MEVSPTKGHIILELKKRLIATLFDQRLSAISKGTVDIGYPTILGAGRYISAGISLRPTVQDLLCISITAQVPRKDLSPMSTILKEIQRVRDHGFNDAEFISAKLKWKNVFTSQIKDIENTSSSSVIADFREHFLRNCQTPLQGRELELETCLEMLEQITCEELTNFVSEMMKFESSEDGKSFSMICYQCPDDHITEDELKETFRKGWGETQNTDIGPWPSLPLESSIMDGPILQKGSVANTFPMSELGAETIELSNGMLCCCRNSNLNNSLISFQAFALGGSSELSEEEEALMSMLDQMANSSGLGTLNGQQLNDLQSTFKTRVNTQRHHYHRGLGGSCPPEHFELMLQMLHLKLTCQPISQQAFDRSIEQQRELVQGRFNNPEYTLMERARILTCGDIPIMRPVTEQVLNRLNLPLAQDLYKRAFIDDPSKFIFVFIGPLPSSEELQKLLSIYLAGIGQSSEDLFQTYKRPWIKNGGSIPTPIPAIFPRERTVEKLSLRLAEKGTVLVAFRVDLPLENAQEDLVLTAKVNATCKLLQTRLLEVLRSQFGDIYSIVCGYGRNSLSPYGLVSISFHCDPEKLDLIYEHLVKEIETLQLEGPTEDEVASIREIVQSRHKVSVQNNSYWLFWILDAFKAILLQRELQQNGSNNKVHQNHLDHSSSHPLIQDEGITKVEEHALYRSAQYYSLLQECIQKSEIQEILQANFPVERHVMLSLQPIQPNENISSNM